MHKLINESTNTELNRKRCTAKDFNVGNSKVERSICSVATDLERKISCSTSFVLSKTEFALKGSH